MIELFVVIAVISVLAALLFPVISKAKSKALTIDCLNNKRQLGIAWTLYANDYDGRLVLNTYKSGGFYARAADPNYGNYCWVTGFMHWDLREDNTNIQYLVDPRHALLADYVGNSARVYKCPEDDYLSPEQREAGWEERVRSVGMNWYVGDGQERGGVWWKRMDANDNSGPLYFLRYNDFTQISPDMIWLFMDVHPDAIFRPPLFVLLGEEGGVWANSIPANYHDLGTTLVFADGHTEHKRWKSPRMHAPVTYKQWERNLDPKTSINNAAFEDRRWLVERTSILLNNTF